jgi:hypothetical protein
MTMRNKATIFILRAIIFDDLAISAVHPSIPQGERIITTLWASLPFVVRYRTMNGKSPLAEVMAPARSNPGPGEDGAGL